MDVAPASRKAFHKRTWLAVRMGLPPIRASKPAPSGCQWIPPWLAKDEGKAAVPTAVSPARLINCLRFIGPNSFCGVNDITGLNISKSRYHSRPRVGWSLGVLSANLPLRDYGRVALVLNRTRVVALHASVPVCPSSAHVGGKRYWAFTFLQWASRAVGMENS